MSEVEISLRIAFVLSYMKLFDKRLSFKAVILFKNAQFKSFDAGWANVKRSFSSLPLHLLPRTLLRLALTSISPLRGWQEQRCIGHDWMLSVMLMSALTTSSCESVHLNLPGELLWDAKFFITFPNWFQDFLCCKGAIRQKHKKWQMNK